MSAARELPFRAADPGVFVRDVSSVLSTVEVSFVVPVHNEAATLGTVLGRTETLPLRAQVVVVDDGSTDASSLIAEEAVGRIGGLVIRQPNRGKGAAIRAALPYVRGDVVVIQDADMEYDPSDVPRLIEPITRGSAEVVFGSRLSGGQPQRA